MTDVIIPDADTLPAQRWWQHGRDCPSTLVSWTWWRCEDEHCGGAWVIVFTDPWQGSRSVYPTHLAGLLDDAAKIEDPDGVAG